MAIAYVMQKTPYVFPIVGGRKVAHLQDNIAALGIALSPAQVAALEAVLPFDMGWPRGQFVRAFLVFLCGNAPALRRSARD